MANFNEYADRYNFQMDDKRRRKLEEARSESERKKLAERFGRKQKQGVERFANDKMLSEYDYTQGGSTGKFDKGDYQAMIDSGKSAKQIRKYMEKIDQDAIGGGVQVKAGYNLPLDFLGNEITDYDSRAIGKSDKNDLTRADVKYLRGLRDSQGNRLYSKADIAKDFQRRVDSGETAKRSVSKFINRFAGDNNAVESVIKETPVRAQSNPVPPVSEQTGSPSRFAGADPEVTSRYVSQTPSESNQDYLDRRAESAEGYGFEKADEAMDFVRRNSYNPDDYDTGHRYSTAFRDRSNMWFNLLYGDINQIANIAPGRNFYDLEGYKPDDDD